ncbi:hypothetical protein EJB05_36375, partial [Eragrostis curvula]
MVIGANCRPESVEQYMVWVKYYLKGLQKKEDEAKLTEGANALQQTAVAHHVTTQSRGTDTQMVITA